MGKVKFLCALLLIMHICTIFCVPVSAAASISTEAGPQLNSAAAYLVDLETQSVLFAQNADEIREPASLTKVMTALLALEYGSLDQTLTVSQSALDALAAEFAGTAPVILWLTAAMGLVLFVLYDLILGRLAVLFQKRFRRRS